MPINSKSYIIVTCDSNSDPKLNLLQLRDGTNNCIQLKPGRWAYTIENCPALKYGFRPKWINHSPWLEKNPNCQSVIEIDLSHFDATEVTDASYMFECMCNLKKVILGNMRFSNVENMNSMFSRCINLEEIVTTGPDTFYSKSLKTARAMFSQAASLKKLSLPCFAHSGVKDIMNIFNSMGNLSTLDLSGWSLRGVKYAEPTPNEEYLFEGVSNLIKVVAIGCNVDTVAALRKQLDLSRLRETIISRLVKI